MPSFDNLRSIMPQRSYGSISSTAAPSNDREEEPQTNQSEREVKQNRQQIAVVLLCAAAAVFTGVLLRSRAGPGVLDQLVQQASALASRSRWSGRMSAINADLPSGEEQTPISLIYPRRPFGTRHGRGVMLPVLGFPSVALARLSDPSDQSLADEAVRHAVQDLGIRYFDVAPEYGDGVAQERLGPALRPYREGVFLAAKTMFRTAEGSANDLTNTLAALKTNRLNLYQFHSISTEQDVDEILTEGGAMETFQKAKRNGVIDAIGFSAHSEPMAIRMIETGLVDTVMFPINFAAYHYGGIGKKVLETAMKYGVGVIALKAGARGRLTEVTGNEVHVPAHPFHHIPEFKRQEMIDFPVRTSKTHPTCWYEPEDDPEELNKLILWSLNQPGVTAVLPPGDLGLFDGIANMLRGKSEVPPFDQDDMQHMLQRYENIIPIFHNRSESGTKVST